MNRPIHDILRQLGDTITAQLEAANDRATTAEQETSALKDGLLALLGKHLPKPQHEQRPAACAANENAVRVEASVKVGPTTLAPGRSFLDVLTTEWQSANTIRNALMTAGLTVAFGTVYSRLGKLTAEFPDLIETETKPQRWRLRAPTSLCGEANSGEELQTCGANDRKESRTRGRGMPVDAVTCVRDRLSDLPSPKQMFAPILHHADCFKAMRAIPDGSVDLIVTDPPYAVTRLNIDAEVDVSALWKEYRRIIKPTGTVIMFGSQPFSSRLIWEARDLFKYDLVWLKNRATQMLHARSRPLKQHEDILVFSAGAAIHTGQSSRRYTYNALGQKPAGTKVISKDKPVNYLRDLYHQHGRSYEATAMNPRSLLFCKKENQTIHPFQKPLDLLEYLIRTYSNEGDTVLDTFMGGGSTCIAAMRSGRRSVGIEMNEAVFEKAKARIASAMPTGASVAIDLRTAAVRIEPSCKQPGNDDDGGAEVARIINGDAVDVMRGMDAKSVDLVVTSPPYNLGHSTGGGIRGAGRRSLWKGAALEHGYASYDDARDPADYIQWQKEVLRECWRVLSDDGAIFYNHKPRVQNGCLQTPLDLNPGLPVRQIVIWNRNNGMNFNRSFFLPSHEWIVIFAKPGFRLRKGAAALKDVWSIPHERNNDHPAPFPVELASRAIESTSAQIVLDPFAGSGSTGVAAMRAGRQFIGIEIDEGYCQSARHRLRGEVAEMAA